MKQADREPAREQPALAAAGEDADERARVGRLLAEMAELAALAHDERAAAQLALAARECARAAEERARACGQEAGFPVSSPGPDARGRRWPAAAAAERARSGGQKAPPRQVPAGRRPWLRRPAWCRARPRRHA